jgi:hypothetical protein
MAYLHAVDLTALVHRTLQGTSKDGDTPIQSSSGAPANPIRIGPVSDQ